MADIFSNKRIEEMMQKASVGTEPKGADIRSSAPDYTTKLMRAFNWYNYEKDIKVARQYLKIWVKNKHVAEYKKFDAVVDELTAPVFGWLARLDLNGAELSEADRDKLNNKVQELLALYQTNVAKAVDVDVDAAPVPGRKSIQEAMAEKQREFLGEMEGEFDAFILNDCKATEFDVFKYMQGNNTAKQYATALAELFTRRRVEFQEAILGADEQLIEAYGCYTAAQMKRTTQWLTAVIEGAERYANFKKANQKVRVKKAKPAATQVARMQYLKESAVPGVRGDVKLVSVSPVQIVGAQQVWVYNIKNKKLGVYNATGAAGFSVRGTSLQGYDPDTSVQRTLRKPDVVIPAMLDAGKVQLRKVLSELTTSETKLNGRINADTLLLRVV